MPNKVLSRLIYSGAPDRQKVWVELTNKFFQEGGVGALVSHVEGEVDRSRKFVDDLLKKISQRPNHVVDIGAGYGGIAICFALKGIKTTIIEPSATQRRCIKEILKHWPKAKPKIRVIDAFSEKLPISNDQADLVILTEVLEHVSSIPKTIHEITRILKPKGHAFISCPNYLYPVEQHYHLLYWPLMSKQIFSSWAHFVLKELKFRKFNSVRDFSIIKSFIFSINYTTHTLLMRHFTKNNLSIKWSLKHETESLRGQIAQHWHLDRSVPGAVRVFMSLPIKITRLLLTKANILPKGLAYLVIKETPGS